MAFAGKIARTHNNKTKFNLYETHKKTKKRLKPKIVRTADYNCAYVTIMAVLIIFTTCILQTVINIIMLSIGGTKHEKAK